MQSLREGMSTKLVNGKIEPKGIKELRVYEKAVLKLVSNPHYVQERETSQFYKAISKPKNLGLILRKIGVKQQVNFK